MEARQQLYYALGILAYAVAKADGNVQSEERQLIQDIVAKESGHNMDFDYAEIIFHILQKDEPGIEYVYDWAMNALGKGKRHLTSELKGQFIKVIRQIAEAFPPATPEERKLIERFSKDLGAFEIIKD